jgi:hypothetical protein
LGEPAGQGTASALTREQQQAEGRSRGEGSHGAAGGDPEGPRPQPPPQRSQRGQNRGGRGGRAAPRQGAGLEFPRARRPDRLKPCYNHQECGECHVYNCPFAHGQVRPVHHSIRFYRRQSQQDSWDRQLAWLDV